jgi:AcrR family transcriptional regulator
VARRGGTIEGGTRSEIVRVAVALFSENGYAATTLDEIATAVGIRKPSLYYYIDSKEDLLYEINALLARELVDTANALIAEADTPPQKLRAFLRATMRLVAARQDEVTIFVSERQTLKSRSPRWREVADRRDAYERIFEGILADGIESGAFVDVPINLAALGILGTIANAFLWYRSDGTMQADEIAELFANIVLRGIEPR